MNPSQPRAFPALCWSQVRGAFVFSQPLVLFAPPCTWNGADPAGKGGLCCIPRVFPSLAGGAARSLPGGSWLLEQPLQVQAPGHGALPGSRGTWGWADTSACPCTAFSSFGTFSESVISHPETGHGEGRRVVIWINTKIDAKHRK